MELQIVRDRAPTPDGEGVIGVGFSVYPAEPPSDPLRVGRVSARMIISQNGEVREESRTPFSLYFEDISKVLYVLRGRQQGVDITHRGTCVRTFGIRHVMGDEVGYEISIGTASHGEAWYEKLRFLMTEHEALGLTCALEHAIGLVCFGGGIYG